MKISPFGFPATRRPHRTGFTLVELLVVMGIIGLILSIALPVTFKARRQASKARSARDLQALTIGLQEYKNNYGQYPQYNFTTSTGSGQQTLYAALTGNNGAGAADPNPKSGRPRSALINVESFRVSIVSGLGQIADSNGLPYLYFVANVPAPDITSSANGGMFIRDYTSGVGPPLYSHSYCSNKISLENMRYLMGDGDKAQGIAPNGYIDPGEVPAYTGPFILWAAGPDAAYGLDINNKCDDITNFDLPAQYIR